MLKIVGVALVLVGIGGCQVRQTPAQCAQQKPTHRVTSPSSTASISFVEKGPDILQWDFQVRGLPAVDLHTGSIVIADLSHGSLASCLGLSLQWMRPDEARPFRTWWLLDEDVASKILYERDGDAKETAALAVKARQQTRDVNEMLQTLTLRPTTPCSVQRIDEWCVQPQRLTCGEISAELQGDTLQWRRGTAPLRVTPGWGAKFIEIDNVYKEAITCIEQAYFDPQSMLLVAQTTSFCKERGGDACIMSNGWRTVTLR